MTTKSVLPVFPLGLETSDSSKLKGFVNTGIIEHAPGAVMAIPEGEDGVGIPSQIRYNPQTDTYEGYYAEGGWLPFGGGGVRWEMLSYNASHTLSAGRGYFINNTTGASTATLPVVSKVGETVTICDAAGKFSTYPLTIDPNGKGLYGSTEPMVISTDNVAATFTWAGEEMGWVVTAGVGLGQGRVYSREIHTETTTSQTSSITLAYQPEIVDIYLDGKRLSESKYVLNGFSVDFADPIAAGVEVQIVEYTPIQLGNGSNSGSSSQVTWVYNDGSAIGGETSIIVDLAGDDVSEIYINSARQQKGIGFTYDKDTNVITLAQALEPEDEVIVKIGGDPTLYNQIDRTPNEVARAANVPLSQVILSTNSASKLDGKTVVFDVANQKGWGIPSGIPLGSTIVSITSGGSMTYAPGNVVVQLLPMPGVIANLLAKDGFKYVGACDSIAELKTLVPERNGQMQLVTSYTAGTNVGGGLFQWVANSTAIEDGGCVIKAASNATGRWLRLYYEDKTPEMYGAIGDGVADDTAAVQRMFTSANLSATLVENFFGSFVMRRKYKISSTIDGGRPIKVDAYGARFIVTQDINCIKFSMHNGFWQGGFFDYTTIPNSTITENSVAILLAPESNPIQVMNSGIRGVRVWGAHTGILFNNDNTAIWMVELSNMEIGVRAGSSTAKAVGIDINSTAGAGGNTTINLSKVAVHGNGDVVGSGLKGYRIHGVNEVSFYDCAYDGYNLAPGVARLVGSGDILDISAFRCSIDGFHTEQLTNDVGPFTNAPMLLNCNSVVLDGFEMLLTISDKGGAWISPVGNGVFDLKAYHDIPQQGKTSGRVVDLSGWNTANLKESFVNFSGNVKPSQVIGGKTRWNVKFASEPSSYKTDNNTTIGTGGIVMALDPSVLMMNISVVGERVGSSDMAWGSEVLCLHTGIGWVVKDTTVKGTNFTAAQLTYAVSGDNLILQIQGDTFQYYVQSRVEYVRGKIGDY